MILLVWMATSSEILAENILYPFATDYHPAHEQYSNFSLCHEPSNATHANRSNESLPRLVHHYRKPVTTPTFPLISAATKSPPHWNLMALECHHTLIRIIGLSHSYLFQPQFLYPSSSSSFLFTPTYSLTCTLVFQKRVDCHVRNKWEPYCFSIFV